MSSENKRKSDNRKSNITVIDNSERFSPLSDTLGYLNRAGHLTIGMGPDVGSKTWSAAREDGTLDKMKKVIEQYGKDHPDLNTIVYLGGSPWPWERLDDIYKRSISSAMTQAKDSKKGIINKTFNALAEAGKGIWAFTQLPIDVDASMNASDHYMPLTDTLTVFTPDEDILRHELGHATSTTETYGNIPHLVVLPRQIEDNLIGNLTGGRLAGAPITTLLEEMTASGNASKNLSNFKGTAKEKSDQASKLLGALGSYTGGAAALLGSIAYGLGKKDMDAGVDAFYKYAPIAPLVGMSIGRVVGKLKGDTDFLPKTLNIRKILGLSKDNPKNEKKSSLHLTGNLDVDIKNAAMYKVASYEKDAGSIPSFFVNMWKPAKNMFSNAGKSIASFANSNKQSWGRFGKNLWEGGSKRNPYGFKQGFQDLGNVIKNDPWSAAGAAGIGALGLYAGNKILS